MSSKNFHILIIGGGIAGPALALFLKKAGLSFALYESYPGINTSSGGLGLAPNGMNVLKELGLSEELKQKGTVITKFSFKNGKGKKIGTYEFDASQLYGEPMVTFARSLLFELLDNEMKHQNLVVNYDKKLQSIEEANNKVVAHFTDGTSAEGDILIGTDGVRSAARRYVLPSQANPVYTGMIVVGGLTPVSAVPSIQSEELNTMTFTFGQNGFFGYAGGNKGDLIWWSNLFRDKEYTREELKNLDLEAIKKEMIERFHNYEGPAKSLISNTTKILRLNVYDVPLLSVWHKGRVLLIGDAAHAVSPNAGQGASMALEDAMYLAKLLRDTNDGYIHSFEKFERDRKPRAERIVAEGRRRGKDKKLVTPLEQKIKELMMQIFIKLFGKNSDKWLYEYKIDWNI